MEFELKLNADEIKLIGDLLVQQPFIKVNDLITKINIQLSEQQKAQDHEAG